jgi:uncharacterized zinc-type alcohol dehydrogenase-like protein
MDALGYAAHSAAEDLVPFRFERRDLRPDDVLIDVLYCGVCHTDLHIGRNHGGYTSYPVVPGHEIVGRVTAVGSAVTGFKVGQHVGVGCMVDSCRHCSACMAGEEESCVEGATFTYNGSDRHDHTKTFGGYSNKVAVSDKFVLRIPDGLDLAGAAPLLCAGITTWAPLHRWNVGKGSKVAVIGLGGLGHMALKLARALGADVTLFTRSPDKEEDAARLGADRVVISTDAGHMASVASRFDLIIDTVPYAHDLNPYIPTLSTHGTLVLVGFMGPLEPPVNAGALVFGQKAIAGSFIGGVAETQEMLDFCGQHGIVSDIEMIAMDEINAAWTRMLKSDVKYRFVIDMATLAD